ncbi:MFS transporter [Nocardia sp. NPDC046473]|uniref:MFS transporter n=1 Tax=Nocardia sp. NPDC046473 TaxID=3155733 RepID=UPI0033F40AB0
MLVVASMAALYPALESVAVTTGANQIQLTWVVNSYTLTLACLVLPGGAFGDRYGRRTALLVGLFVLTLSSAAPLLFRSPELLICSRAAAGAGAALVMPPTLSLMTSEFPESQIGRAVGIWAGIAGAGGMLGIAGTALLLTWLPWPYIFVILTIGSSILFGLALTIPVSREYYTAREPLRSLPQPPVDALGSISSATGVALVVLALMEAPSRGWQSPVVIALGVVGVAALAAFIRIELRVQQPLLDVRLFTVRGFGSGAVTITTVFLGAFGVVTLLIQYLPIVFGYSAMRSAFALTPITAPLIVVSLISPKLAERFGLRAVTVSGLIVFAVGLFICGRLSSQADYFNLMWSLLTMGVGLGLGMAPATAAIVAETPAGKQGVGAAVNDVTRELGAAIGIAVAGSVLAAGYSARIGPILHQMPTQAREPAARSAAAALDFAGQTGPAAQPIADSTTGAFIYGFANATYLLGGVMAGGAVLVAAFAPSIRSST